MINLKATDRNVGKITKKVQKILTTKVDIALLARFAVFFWLTYDRYRKINFWS
jgi:hypothetical protein